MAELETDPGEVPERDPLEVEPTGPLLRDPPPPPGFHERTVAVNGIRMHYVEQGAGVPVILCHGFPHLWFSWRHQIPVIAQAGFRAVAPDMRGMGQTDAPADVAAYDVSQITADLLGLLDAIDEERAVFQAEFSAVAAEAPGSQIIGSAPVLIEPCDIVAIAEGGSGFSASATG